MLHQLDLTPALRPQLLPDETLLAVQNAVGLYEGKYKIANYQNGCAYLTSHRVCYVDNEDPRKYSVAVELKDVDRLEPYAGFLTSSAKIVFFLKTEPSASTPASPHTPRISSPQIGTPLIRPASPAVRNGVWICTICSFSNIIPSNYLPGATHIISPCLACGILPQASVLDEAIKKLEFSSSRLSQASVATLTDDLACPRCTFHNHPSLLSCEMCGERLRESAPRSHHGDLLPRSDSPAPTSKTSNLVGEIVKVIKVSFRTGGDKVFYERLKMAILQRKWLLQNAPPVPAPSSGCKELGDNNARSGAGIAGLERKGIQLRRKNELALGGAFEDLEALMGRAKELKELAESFATKLSSTPDSLPVDTSVTLRESTHALGLVTKDMLGTSSSDQDLYITELARQLAEFLSDDKQSILKKEGGVMTLVDLWAIYNRARGIDLISPGDLEKAARMFEKLKLPVRVRKFKSGLLVVQEARRTDEETIRKFLGWLEEVDGWGRGVTPQEVSEIFKWSLGVATEELEMAEERGSLCRETGVEGTRFWRNWFELELETPRLVEQVYKA